MNVKEELPVRRGEMGMGVQVGWFRPQPYHDPMPPVISVKRYGLVVVDTHSVRTHPNYTPLVEPRLGE